LSKLLGTGIGLERVQHDADALGQLIQEGQVYGAELIEGRELNDREHLAFE